MVQNSDGTTAVSTAVHLYFCPAHRPTRPVSARPTSGPETGETAITITGAQFAPGATVTVRGVPATDVQVLSNTRIVAVTPAGAEGPPDVLVSNVNGASAPRSFVYEPLTVPVLTCDLGADADPDAVADGSSPSSA